MKRMRSAGWYALFVLPLVFVFTTVVIVPFFIGIGYSFFSWDGLPLNPKIFVRFNNFVKIFSDERFFDSIVHTVIFTVLTVITINFFGLLFSLVVTTKLKVRNFVRAMLFMPYLIGGLILGYIWKFILGEGFSKIGESIPHFVFFNWLLSPTFALLAISVVATWQMAGYIMIIYITGIQGISEAVIEASKVDRAGFWKSLFKIKFPLIMQSFTICFFFSLSNCFKIFDVNYSLTGGGPSNSTEMLAINIYNEIFQLNHFGYGQAKAIVFFVVVAIIALIQVYITKKREVEM